MGRRSIQEIKHISELRVATQAVLFQLADDDMVIGFRDQEWLGLAPHIEEDVAFGSIAQEEIGHAAHYYELLSQLGLGSSDDLASLRPADERRNSVLLERPNGLGTYLDAPHFDWAFTIMRHFFHDVWEMICLGALTESGVTELGLAANKILAEKRYHRAHQELWIKTMLGRGGLQGRDRVNKALADTSEWVADLPDFGGQEHLFEETGIVPGASTLSMSFWQEIDAFMSGLGLQRPSGPVNRLNGRQGQHTPALQEALQVWSEVYRLEPGAQW